MSSARRTNGSKIKSAAFSAIPSDRKRSKGSASWTCGRLLRAVPVCVARAVRDMADAPAAQPFIRATAAWFESQTVGGATGARIAPAGESGAGISSGGAHVTQYKEQEG